MADNTITPRVQGWMPLITRASERYGVPVDLIASVIHAESGGKPGATGGDGEYGLMQLLPTTARGLGLKPGDNPYDPAINIDLGTKYLSQHLKRFRGNEYASIVAYNQGEGATERAGGSPNNPKTSQYAQFVSERRKLYAQATPSARSYADMLSAHMGLTAKGASGTLASRTEVSAPQARSYADMLSAQMGLTTPQTQAMPPSTPGATGAWASGATGTWETDAPAQPGAESPQRSDSGAGYLGMMPGFEFMGVLPQDTQESIARDAPGVIRDVAATGINVAGPAVGAAVGAASRIPGGAVMGEMAGSYGARKLNVALGLEEEGMIGDATSVVIPGAVRTAGALWKPTLRHLPGASAALHEEQGKVLQALPETIQPPVPSAQLYAEVAQQNPMIRPGSIWRGASDVISRDARRAPTLQGGKGVQFARDVHDIVRANGGQIPLQTLNDYRKDLGLLIRQAAKENWPEQRALRSMYKSFYDDLDHAAAKNVPGAQLLKEANKAARSEFAAEDLGEMFANGHAGIITRPDGLTQLHGGKLRDSFEKRLASDDLFRGSFTPSQVLGIRETFKDIEKLPRMSPPRGQVFGSGMAITRAGLAGVVTQAVTGSPTAATVAGSAAASLPYYIGHLLMTDSGRAWLVSTLAKEGSLSPAALGMLSGGARQLSQGETVEHTPLPE